MKKSDRLLQPSTATIGRCKGTVASVASDNDEQVASVLCSVKTTKISNSEDFSLPGSTQSLITADLREQLQLPIQAMTKKSLFANRKLFSVLGVCSALVSLNSL